MRSDNPFLVTKAVDFTNEQIAETFVDLPKGGFSSLADPAGSMPTYLVGGKGGGRTHLLRYYSFELQRIRSGGPIFQYLEEQGYVGIYFRCGGLNSNRFAGKGQNEDVWSSVFAQYMDLWLSELYLDALGTIVESTPGLLPQEQELALVDEAKALLSADDPQLGSVEHLRSLRRYLAGLRSAYDRDINNAALTRRLDVRIVTTPGTLVFRLPKLAAAYMPRLHGIIISYLLDELENLTEQQQRYVNTLIREKELPCNFIIGSRLHGLRTMVTLSAEEENKQGSEYDLVILEDQYRGARQAYADFCRKVVVTRLAEAGYPRPRDKRLSSLFEEAQRPEDTPWRDLETRAVIARSTSEDAPYMRRLHQQLREFGLDGLSAEEVVGNVRVIDHPLLEKFAVSRMYRIWARGAQPDAASRTARGEVASLLLDNADRRTVFRWNHWKDDLLAQLYVDYRQPVPYEGIDEFIALSGYLPRNLLVILKQVTRWALYMGEEPYLDRGPVSRDAQARGVREAADWFLRDRKALGEIGEDAQQAVRRLGGFFREFRYSDKPTEVSLCAFSTDRQQIGRRALQVLDTAVLHNLLIEVRSGTRHRNSSVWHHIYQLNPILSPIFDLPVARRGVLPMAAEEIEAVFDLGLSEDEYHRVVGRRIATLEAPFRNESPDGAAQGRLL